VAMMHARGRRRARFNGLGESRPARDALEVAAWVELAAATPAWTRIIRGQVAAAPTRGGFTAEVGVPDDVRSAVRGPWISRLRKHGY
jgi:hypothetical protein